VAHGSNLGKAGSNMTEIHTAPLRRKLEAWYLVSTGAPTTYGTITWAARQLGVGRRAVQRWFTSEPSDRRTMSRQTRASLRMLEQLTVMRYGQYSIDQAMRRLATQGDSQHEVA